MISVENRANGRDKRALEFIENVTRNADEVQAQVLAQILTRNADTEYVKRYGLSGRTDRDTFKNCLPLITYDDIKPEINRIANGDTSPILSAQPISEFLLRLLTSPKNRLHLRVLNSILCTNIFSLTKFDCNILGTSGGQSKLVPTIEEDLERRALLISLIMPIMNQYMQGLDQGKGMWIARTLLLHKVSIYCQLLCGLLQNYEVLRMGAIFASGFIRTIRFLEEHWRQLCLDINTGILNKEVTDPSVREAVEKLLLNPNPELAQLIERECSAPSWQGIITRLWPNTRYIKVIVTGAMAQYVPTLDYYRGGLPLVCTMYSSSEGSFELNLNPLCNRSDVSYTLRPNMAYFEFLPVHRQEFGPTNPKTLDEKEQEGLVKLVDVKIGQEYELVVTTYAGLCRYRMGDVLRVTGFHNAAPQFHFVCRQNVALSIHTEKTNEAELQSSVEKCVKHLKPFKITVMDYTSFADTSTSPGHYVLYCELRYNTKEVAGAVPSSVFENCCLTIEESLNSVYRQGRGADKSIGSLEIRIVEGGTFEELMDRDVRETASINRYKAPRCAKSSLMVELLNSRVTHSYFSPRLPMWASGSAVSQLVGS
eukprot:PITA_05261